MIATLAVEAVMTCIFVMVILCVTEKTENNSVAGLVIGLTLALIHFFGIGLTGTSVNPARSLGPALFAGGTALNNVWVFIAGPLIGAVIAAGLYLGILKTVKKDNFLCSRILFFGKAVGILFPAVFSLS